jgi:hypothetical protein
MSLLLRGNKIQVRNIFVVVNLSAAHIHPGHSGTFAARRANHSRPALSPQNAFP